MRGSGALLGKIMPTARHNSGGKKVTRRVANADFAEVPHEQLALWMSEMLVASDHALIFVDDLWRIEYWSVQAEQLLGWKTNSVVGKGLGGVLGLTPDGNRRLRESFAVRAPVLRQRISLRKAGGAKIDLTVMIRQLPARPDGSPNGCLVSLQDDVTSRVTQEFQKFFHAVDQSMMGALMANPHATIEYANPRAVEILGLSPMELIGCSLTGNAGAPADALCLVPDGLGELNELDDFADWRGDIIYQHPDGRHLMLYVIASGIRDGSGSVVNRVLLFEDLTERRAIEQAERDLRDHMAHAGRLAALGEMATSIAHEINQPLAAIANYSQGSLRRIESGTDQSAAVVGALEEISRQVERAGAIIKNVRRLASHQETEMAPVQLDLLIRQLLPMLNINAKNIGSRLDYQCNHAAPLVMGNETQLSQIILNLSKNGFDAMVECSPEKRHLLMRIEDAPAHDGKAHLSLIVQDQGCGIADDDLAKIGTPFFTRKINGLGLGLSMSRTLLEAHGSHLVVKRNVPPLEGMTFSFTLPVCQTLKLTGGNP